MSTLDTFFPLYLDSPLVNALKGETRFQTELELCLSQVGIDKKISYTYFDLIWRSPTFEQLGVFHRVSIERTSPYKESYTVNNLPKMFL